MILASLSFTPLSGGTALADVDQPEIPVIPIEDVQCAAYCVYDKTADTIIMDRQSHNRIYPASMTKIMTFQLGLDYLDPDDYVTVSQNAIDNVTSDSTLMYLLVGEEVKVSELYYGMMLPSGNDAANVVAEAVIAALFEKYPAGGEAGPDGVTAEYITDALGLTADEVLTSYPLSAFAELMNLRARNLGCTGTHFTNANGLHDDNHYTTASDLCLLMANATRNPDFNTVISSPTHVFQATNLHTEDAWSVVRNTNTILTDPWLTSRTAEGEDTHISAFVGGKTGTTSVAGTGMTTYSVNENGHELMIAVCGIPYELYSNQARFVASVVAYGNLACWNSEPVSVIPGTLGDYQRFNWTAAERPEYDPLIVPGDVLPESYGFTPETVPSQAEEYTEETVPGETVGEVIIGGDAQDDVAYPAYPDSTEGSFIGRLLETRVGRFVSLNTGVSVFILVLILIIIFLLSVLIARSIKYRKARKRRAQVRTYNGRKPTF